MIYLAWVISLVVVALLGYHYHALVDTVSSLKLYAEKKREEAQPEEAPSVIIDPDDLAQQIQREVKEKREALNLPRE